MHAFHNTWYTIIKIFCNYESWKNKVKNWNWTLRILWIRTCGGNWRANNWLTVIPGTSVITVGICCGFSRPRHQRGNINIDWQNQNIHIFTKTDLDIHCVLFPIFSRKLQFICIPKKKEDCSLSHPTLAHPIFSQSFDVHNCHI